MIRNNMKCSFIIFDIVCKYKICIFKYTLAGITLLTFEIKRNPIYRFKNVLLDFKNKINYS